MSSKIVRTAAVFCGHGISSTGSMDSGCVYGKYTEAALVANITNSCVKYLKQAGVNVITDAPKNKINMYAQVNRAESAKLKPDVYIAFHCDYSKSPKGTLPLYVSESGRQLAKRMNQYVVKYSSLKTRGLCKRTDLYELNATSMPAVIFECGSIKGDLQAMREEYDAIGFGAARGICKYLGVPFNVPKYKLVSSLEKLESTALSKHYKYKQIPHLSKGTINCAAYISWGLRKAGILPKGKGIWLGNQAHGNGVSYLKKKGKITHPNKVWYKCGLQIGDIVGFQWGEAGDNKVHTMVLLRFSGGYPVWATCGGSDIKAKDLSRRRKAYEKRAVKTLIRLK